MRTGCQARLHRFGPILCGRLKKRSFSDSTTAGRGEGAVIEPGGCAPGRRFSIANSEPWKSRSRRGRRSVHRLERLDLFYFGGTARAVPIQTLFSRNLSGTASSAERHNSSPHTALGPPRRSTGARNHSRPRGPGRVAEAHPGQANTSCVRLSFSPPAGSSPPRPGNDHGYAPPKLRSRAHRRVGVPQANAAV